MPSIISTIKIKGKRYFMIDILTAKEYREAMVVSEDITEVMMSIKEDTSKKNIQELVQKLSTLKLDDWKRLEACVMRCYGLTQQQIDAMRVTEPMLLFTALWQQSTAPKKKLFEPSPSE